MSGFEAGLMANAEFLERNYEAWKRDRKSVPPAMASFFEGFEFAHTCDPATLQGKQLQSRVDSLVYHYRSIGHRVAQINPLVDEPRPHEELDLAKFGLGPQDLETVFNTNHIPGMPTARLADIIEHVRETYCGHIGVEYMHIQETAERRWLQERMEPGRNRPKLTGEQRLRTLWKLQKAEMFERFLHSTYRGQKRFSLEGSETLVAAMDYLIEKCPSVGVHEIVIGMTHRGRLNVLTNIMEKSYDDVFSEFEENYTIDTTYGDGDVKYHKGYSNDILTSSGALVHLSLTPNPSHLEAVGPVVEGKVRAKQAARGDLGRKHVLPCLIHGDAAFAGQGIVAETFNLSQLKGYHTGGTVHFIVNNQVGFTTTAEDYLSGTYATDMAKMVAVPIFHVNGDRPEYVLHVVDIALDYRQRFGKDVVVDMWCYRRHGHNEADEPSFTQPLLYSKIADHPSVVTLYMQQIEESGRPTEAESAEVARQFEAKLEEARRNAHEGPRAGPSLELKGRWKRMHHEYSHEPVETGVSADVLRKIALCVATVPDGFEIHRKLRKLFDDLRATVENDGDLQWAGAETMAFGSLLMEGTGVRLSGEDSRRGTFSQRHGVLYDQKTGEQYVPLTNLAPTQPQFCIYDSSLAEASVLAFDFGYSLSDPDRLICWEAQFGDFANGAQVIIDQFIAGAFSKWRLMSGLVMLLPHGYEGQGPEHSNAWLRRYLSLCAEDNIQVTVPSTPAQYFHLLRRQIRRPFRRPLVILTPKSLLRNPQCVSPVEDLRHGTFREIIDDERGIRNPRRVLFCAGKVYYDLIRRAEEEGVNDVAIVRVEQFYPIHEALWEETTAAYASAQEWAWVSEEPTNYGAWGFMHAMLATYRPGGKVWFVGRARSASPATGSLAVHKQQQERIVEFALQSEPLGPELVDGVAVFTRGEELWHMKSRSPLLANR